MIYGHNYKIHYKFTITVFIKDRGAREFGSERAARIMGRHLF